MTVFYGPETAATRRCEHGKLGDEFCAPCTGEAMPPPPYPFCRTPDLCAGRGYCKRDPACNE